MKIDMRAIDKSSDIAYWESAISLIEVPLATFQSTGSREVLDPLQINSYEKPFLAP
jgi:hypothetical protein